MLSNILKPDAKASNTSDSAALQKPKTGMNTFVKIVSYTCGSIFVLMWVLLLLIYDSAKPKKYDTRSNKLNKGSKRLLDLLFWGIRVAFSITLFALDIWLLKCQKLYFTSSISGFFMMMLYRFVQILAIFLPVFIVFGFFVDDKVGVPQIVLDLLLNVAGVALVIYITYHKKLFSMEPTNQMIPKENTSTSTIVTKENQI
jgi:hypothetical protein